ncbi:Synaptotagmin-C [Portunus trituberculatus]|uniref:Synaptotagmin-C n=1 Tax=Portunus trituberculatus TaxID=210409 RepID=A0A5B7KEH0_PORTR|nr:Synaptotagmin-C [Portunus trituberculatus]
MQKEKEKEEEEEEEEEEEKKSITNLGRERKREGEAVADTDAEETLAGSVSISHQRLTTKVNTHALLLLADPYVKVCLLCQGRRIKKKKTTVKKSTLNPVYNEALVFDIPNENIEDVTLLVKVVDYDR